MLTQAHLQQILEYEPSTGEFRWKVFRNAHGAKQGDIAGGVNAIGYRAICINYKLYAAHRLAWIIMTGSWPSSEIDHINGVRDDNRWVNLREATSSQNKHNRTKLVTNTSGYMGVAWMPRQKKWKASFFHQKKLWVCGYFLDKTDGAISYNYHIAHIRGQFANLNKIESSNYLHD